MQIKAKKKAPASDTTPSQHQARRRHISGGVEFQPPGAGFMGTPGGFVRAISGPSRVFALSNNHVLADTNRLPIGKEISQPCSSSLTDVFARLTSFETIHLPVPTNPFPARNRVDAAIARVSDTALVRTGSMFGISNYTPTLKAPLPGMTVTKIWPHNRRHGRKRYRNTHQSCSPLLRDLNGSVDWNVRRLHSGRLEWRQTLPCRWRFWLVYSRNGNTAG